MYFSAKGFTLIELLVAVTIISIVSLIGYASLGPLKEEKTFKNAVLDLQSLIKTTQSNASSQVKCKTSSSAAKWAVVFNTSDASTEIFCDDQQDSDTSLCKNAKSWISQKKLELTKINTNIEISSIAGEGGQTPLGDTIICFSALSGSIEYADGSQNNLFNASKSVTLTLRNKKTSATSTLVINKGGSVDVQ